MSDSRFVTGAVSCPVLCSDTEEALVPVQAMFAIDTLLCRPAVALLALDARPAIGWGQSSLKLVVQHRFGSAIFLTSV